MENAKKMGKRVSINKKKLEEIGGILVINNDTKCVYYTILLHGRVKCVIKREKGAEGVFIMTEEQPIIKCRRIKASIKEGRLIINCFSPDRELNF